ncbi:hypothetical protein [Aeromicrobium sp. Root495]|uniref:hypothetical protein n=1 Tax=Aeromicrobium sp. Root495 TaxID=1736550 RepID=UPI0012E8A142|nr:hypothetical protein [Aeromicrobium sp. Root495]
MSRRPNRQQVLTWIAAVVAAGVVFVAGLALGIEPGPGMKFFGLAVFGLFAAVAWWIELGRDDDDA